MKKIAGIAAILAPIVAASLLAVSDVQGGAALVPAGKTSGAALIATVVMDVTGGSSDPGKGLTSIRIQKAGTSTAAIFQSGYVHSFVDECISSGFPDVQTSTANRFTGLINGFVDTPTVLTSLVGQFGDPNKAAITSQDDVACTTVDGRQILSFTGLIRFAK